MKTLINKTQPPELIGQKLPDNKPAAEKKDNHGETGENESFREVFLRKFLKKE